MLVINSSNWDVAHEEAARAFSNGLGKWGFRGTQIVIFSLALPCGHKSNIPGLVNIQKAIEHGHWNSGFTHEKMWFSIFLVDLHSYKRVDLFIVFCMFTRGYVWCYCVSLEVWMLITSPARSVTCDILIFNDSTVQDQGCVQDSVA